MDNKYFSMKETCEITGLSYDTLKFYCNEGLIPDVKRNKNNYRIFDEKNIGWINSLNCLKKCEMSNSEIKSYMKLCMDGISSIPERKKILDKKMKELADAKKKIDESIEFIKWKQGFYDDGLSGKVQYFSYLIRDDKN